MTIPTALPETSLYRRLRELSQNDAEVRALVAVVDDVFARAKDLMKTVIIHLPHYTLHDDVHLVAVVDIMGRLLGEEGINNLSPLELAGCILAAALHDIGMASSESEINELRNAIQPGQQLTKRQEEYIHFRQNRPSILRRRAVLRHNGKTTMIAEIDDYLLAEYIRLSHGSRTAETVRNEFRSACVYAGKTFSDELARVCVSHTQDADKLEQLPEKELVRMGGERCNWRFIAVLLRLADVLDFDPKRAPRTLFVHLGVRNNVSIIEWMKHRAIRGWDIGPGIIEFSARCQDPVIEEAIRNFIDVINDELRSSRQILSGLHASQNAIRRYTLQLPAEVATLQIGPDTDSNGKPLYEYYPLRFRLDPAAIMEILMGVSLYGESYFFLRELLQNAADACRHRRAAESSDYKAEITVRITEESGQYILDVEDNGMGMTHIILDRYFAKVGRSYYQSSDFATDVGGQAFRPISRFGIGVLSVFMVGDRLQVDTLSARGKNESAWFVEIADEGALFWLRESQISEPGTRIRLHLTEDIQRALPNGNASRVTQSDGSISQVVTPFDRLLGTIALVAPKLEIPVRVESGNRSDYFRVSPPNVGGWGVEKGLTVHQDLIKFDEGDIPGLCGALRFYVLVDGLRRPVRIVPLSDVELINEEPRLIGPAKYGEYYTAQPGAINRMTIRPDSTYGHSLQSVAGTYTQQGFRVPNTTLFGHGPALIPTPFPIVFDIDLSGDLCLSLTADRTRIMDTAHTRSRVELIARQVWERVFRQLASSKALQPNPALIDTLVAQLAQFAAPVAAALAAVRQEIPQGI